MKRCPNCGNNHFYVTAHVTQDWIVDEDEDFVECTNECGEVVHRPDDEDIWTCTECGYTSSGDTFNVINAENKTNKLIDTRDEQQDL